MSYSNVTTISGSDNDDFGMNVEFQSPRTELLGDGFNEYGVRENEDGSVDVRFNAMEVGTRRGIDIEREFLQNVISHDYSEIPVQLDHSRSQRANVGYIDPSMLNFSDRFLQLQAHFPNTGSSVRQDIISDFTHDPPQIRDGSVSLDKESVKVERPKNSGENPKFVDAKLKEFSLTPFPAGYDNGGLTAEFSEAVSSIGPVETNDEQCGCSQLQTKNLRRKNYE